MDAFFTNYGLQRILKIITGKVIATSFPLYLGYSQTAPAQDGTNVTEPSNSTYARTLLNNCAYSYSGGTTVFGDPTVADGVATVKNTSRIVAPEPYDVIEQVVQDWGELPYACIFDAATNGNLLMVCKLETAIHPGADGKSSIPIVRIGDLSITLKNVEVTASTSTDTTDDSSST